MINKKIKFFKTLSILLATLLAYFSFITYWNSTTTSKTLNYLNCTSLTCFNSWVTDFYTIWRYGDNNSAGWTYELGIMEQIMNSGSTNDQVLQASNNYVWTKNKNTSFEIKYNPVDWSVVYSIWWIKKLTRNYAKNKKFWSMVFFAKSDIKNSTYLTSFVVNWQNILGNLINSINYAWIKVDLSSIDQSQGLSISWVSNFFWTNKATTNEVPGYFVYFQNGSNLSSKINTVASYDYLNTKHEVGKIESDSGSTFWKVLSTQVSQYWNLVYGNIVNLNTGAYDINFRIKTTDISKNWVYLLAWIEWQSNKQESYLKEYYGKDFISNNVYIDFKIKFNVNKNNSSYIPYLFVTWAGQISLDNIEITKNVDIIDYNLTYTWTYVYEENNLSSSVWEIVDDISAINGKVIKWNKWQSNYWYLTWWPYSQNEASGNHKAIFRLKTDDITNSWNICKIEVFNSDWDGVNKSIILKGNDFAQNNTFEDFEISYIRTNSWNIEFRTLFYWSWNVFFDNVKSVWEFTKKDPPTISDFKYDLDEVNNTINITFLTNSELANIPNILMWDKKFEFINRNGYIYTYKFSDYKVLAGWTYDVKLEKVIDMFWNEANNITLWQIITKDTTPPLISNIILSSWSLNSFETLIITFDVNEELKEKPIVKIGDNFANFENNSWSTYKYYYVANDISASPIQTEKNIIIQTVDLTWNIWLDSSKKINFNISNSTIIYEAEELPGSTWIITNDDDSYWFKTKKALKWENAGFITFWPYTNNLIENRYYVAKFRLKTSNKNSTLVLATIDVFNSNWSWNRVFKTIRWTDFNTNWIYQDFELKFLRTADGVMEYRVNFTWNEDLYVDRISIEEYKDTGTETYESEDLYWIVWSEIIDTQASWGKAIVARVWVDNPGSFQFWPYATWLKNWSSYTAKFFLKVADNTSNTPIWLIDVYDGTTWYREYREIKASDFSNINTYEWFDIDFQKTDSPNIEFRVFFYWIQNIWADKVDVIGQTIVQLPEYQSANLPWIVGDVIFDSWASNSLVRVARAWIDPEGNMQFWPYDSTNLIDGLPYKAIFRLKVKDNMDSSYIWLIDVYNWDTWYRQYQEIRWIDFEKSWEFQNFEINFIKPNGTKNMEYRVFFYWKLDIYIDKVTIVNSTNIWWLPSFESERLPSRVGRITTDVSASNNKWVNLDVWTAWWMQFGPYKVNDIVTWDVYKANFRLKTNDNTINDYIAILDVYNSQTWMDYKLPIKWTDFLANWSYQEFGIIFTPDDLNYLEFRINATWLGNIFADKVYLSK